MFLFLVGIVIGMWLAQSFSVPNVQTFLSRWSAPATVPVTAPAEVETPTPPVFTGEMPVK